MRKIIKVLKYFLAVLVSLLFVIFLGSSFLNRNRIIQIPKYHVFIVLSGSMEANIKIGDLVVTKNVLAEDLKVGDVISFYDDYHAIVTHRIVRIENGNNGKQYVTKGDHNNTEDHYETTIDDILGVVFLKIPKVGKFILFLQQRFSLVIVGFMVLIFLLMYPFGSNKESK